MVTEEVQLDLESLAVSIIMAMEVVEVEIVLDRIPCLATTYIALISQIRWL